MPNLVTHGRMYTAHIDVANREQEWLEQLKIDIKNSTTFENNVLINLTWFNPEEDNLYKILLDNNPTNTKIWLAASIDGINWMYNGKFHQELINKGFSYSFVGFGPDHWNSWMPKWIYENNRNKKVELYPNFNHYFLSYNRKPKYHRHEFVEKVIANNLLHCGWVTYNQNVFPEIDNYTGKSDIELLNEDKRFTRPEDMATIGNLETWKHSFCIVVTETEYNDPWQVSEKTWKPIMGLRPFIIIGHKNLQNILKNQGLFTSKDFFNRDFECTDDIICFLKELTSKTKEEIYQLYIQMLPKLEHNKNRLIELAHKTRIL